MLGARREAPPAWVLPAPPQAVSAAFAAIQRGSAFSASSDCRYLPVGDLKIAIVFTAASLNQASRRSPSSNACLAAGRVPAFMGRCDRLRGLNLGCRCRPMRQSSAMPMILASLPAGARCAQRRRAGHLPHTVGSLPPALEFSAEPSGTAAGKAGSGPRLMIAGLALNSSTASRAGGLQLVQARDGGLPLFVPGVFDPPRKPH